MASEVSICNAGLALVGEPEITALNDTNDTNAIACNEAYARLRDALLRKHRWAFATKRAALAASSTAPAFGPTNYFPVPSDFIRLLPRDENQTINTHDWKIENSGSAVCIATDDSAPLNIRYTAQITDPNQMDPLFREALSALIAKHIARKILSSSTLVAEMNDAYEGIVAEAKNVNSIEKAPIEPPEDSWVTARA